MNGWDLLLPDSQAASLLLELIEQHHHKAWLAERLAQVSRPRPSLELRDFLAVLTTDHIAERLEPIANQFQMAEFNLQETGSAIPMVTALCHATVPQATIALRGR